MLNFKGITGAVVVGLALTSHGAFAADDVKAKLTGYEWSAKTGSTSGGAGPRQVKISTDGGHSFGNDTYAGAFEGEFLSGESFAAFCVDVTQNSAAWGAWTTYTEIAIDSVVADNLTTFANKYYSLVNDRNTSAAFQLAMWEIVTEGTSNFSLTAGTFQVKGASGSASVISFAQGWLNGMDDDNVPVTGNYSLQWLANGQKQDLLVLTPIAAVPEPATYGMLLVGVGLVGAFARRRSTSSIRA